MTSVLRSNALEKEFTPGNDGFYFQHRKGKLDLRRFSKLDIDKIVRNVDIETIQEHLEHLCFSKLIEDDLHCYTDTIICKLFQLTQYTIEYLLFVQEQLSTTLNSLATKYMKKKKSLQTKRKEMIELQEMAKSYQAEIQTKKRNIEILESKLQQQKSIDEREDVIEPEKIQFYVTNAKGICVQFNLENSITVRELLRDIHEAFVSKRHRRSKSIPVVKVMYQGKFLLEDWTLAMNQVRSGDTLVVQIEDDDEDHLSDDEKPSSAPLQPQNDHFKDFMNMQSEAYRNMVEELRGGFETALKALTPSIAVTKEPRPDSELLSKLEDKWTRVELSVRQQLDTQMTHYDTLLKELLSRDKRPIVFGDLEDDKDNEELRERLNESLHTIKSLQSSVDLSESELSTLRQQLATQAHQIEDLRDKLSLLSTAPSITQSVPAPAATKDVAVSAVIEAMMVPSSEGIERPESVSEYISDSEEESKLAQSDRQESLIEAPPFEVIPPLSEDVDIVLRLDASSTEKYRAIPGLEDEVVCSVPRSILPDDLVFEVI